MLVNVSPQASSLFVPTTEGVRHPLKEDKIFKIWANFHWKDHRSSYVITKITVLETSPGKGKRFPHQFPFNF